MAPKDLRKEIAIKSVSYNLRENDQDAETRASVPPSEIGSAYKEKLEYSPSEKWRIIKNISMISLAFTFLYTAFQGMMNIQSTINAEHGLGTTALSSIYFVQIFSCIFLPKYMIQKLTVKWTMVITLSFYTTYIAAQFYPRFFTFIPAAVLVGLGAAPMWAAHSTYITQLAQVYSKIVNIETDVIIVRFFGFFFFAFQTQDLWGNLISSLIFLQGEEPYSVSSGNLTSPLIEKIRHCGAEFCRFTDEETEKLPPRSEINLITLIYVICVALAVVITFLFTDPLTRYGEKRNEDNEDQPSAMELVMATLSQLRRPNQQLLICLTVFVGMEQAFSSAEFTQAFVSCALGVGNVGFVMISFGVANCSSAMAFGYLIEYLGRLPIFCFGIVLHAGLIITATIWNANPEQEILFYVYASLWGSMDGLWQSQVNGLYGSMFKSNKEAAFSNYRLWEAVGFTISLGTSPFLCLRTKCYILLTMLALGAIGYLIVEIRHRKKEKRLAQMEAASYEEQKKAHMERVQSQSFDALEEDIFVVEDDDATSMMSGASHHSRFRKSIAFFVGSDVLHSDEVRRRDSRRITLQNNRSLTVPDARRFTMNERSVSST